jgi:hypothetical protein
MSGVRNPQRPLSVFPRAVPSLIPSGSFAHPERFLRSLIGGRSAEPLSTMISLTYQQSREPAHLQIPPIVRVSIMPKRLVAKVIKAEGK